MGGSQAKVLLIGLDNAGKTTILSRLIDPDHLDPNITPTIGFQKKKFSRNQVNFQVLDMSGQAKYRDLWKSNATASKQDRISGIIFVVDSTNKMRINVARNELEIILENQLVPKKLPFLFYSNKYDLKDSINVAQVEQILKLKEINRNYRICACSGLTGNGLEAGIEWFSLEVKKVLQSQGR